MSIRSAPASSLVLLALAACVLGAPVRSQELRWRSGARLPVSAASERPARDALARALEQGGARHALVRFARPLDAHERRLWTAAGVEIGRALGGGAYSARIRPAALDRRATVRLPGLVDVRELELGWKLHPALFAGETPPWTVAELRADGVPIVALYVLLHPDEALERGDELVRALGGGVLDVLETVNGLVALVPRSRVAQLASADPVLWVEPALPRLSEVANDSNRALVQADALQAAPYGLDGSGVDVLVYDGGTARASHVDFGGRLTTRDSSFTIDHATHVSATVGGDGSASGGTYRGIAPGVTIESYGFEHDGSGIFFFTNPGDFESDYDDAINAHGADIANNSLSTNVESNDFFCPLQGDYCVLSSLIDGVVRGSLGAPFRIVWANGNERSGSRCDVEGFGDYYSTPPPAGAKNHIAVGALNSNDDSMSYFSSWGPTDDGRLRPDVSAPGCQSNGDFGVTSASAASDTSYTVYCGTSMASPTVCGIGALILQDYRARFGGPDPRNSTLKALLAQTAQDRGNPGPDYQFGYGSVRAKDAIDSLRLGNFREQEILEQGESRSWSVEVPPGAPELRLTLAWDDVPGALSILGSLVNDLDLVVLDPLGARHHVWTLDPGNPSAVAVQTGPDRANNLEQVLVSAPVAGTWTVAVLGHSVPEGPQVFSLVSSHALVDEPQVQISFPSGLPVVLTPGVATTVTARIQGVNDSVLAGTPTLHVRHDGGAFLAFALTPAGGDLYQAELPPPVCSATPEFYLSAQGAASGLATNPPGAPAALHTALVTDASTVFADDFETDQGWSVANAPGLLDGPWERAVPGAGGDRLDPLRDHDGSGTCFVTDNSPGNSDVDEGPTRLLSPVLDLSIGGELELSYARWFNNYDDFEGTDDDPLVVEISNDGGASWIPVETVQGPGGGWVVRSFLVGDLVAPTAQVRVRFSVSDVPNDSVTEAGLDAFRVERRECGSLPDCNGNGILDSDDIAGGSSLDADLDGRPDECGPPSRIRRAGPPGSAPSVQVP